MISTASTLTENLDFPEALALSHLVRDLNSKGHNPATSGNYSLRSKVNTSRSLVSESGIDKSLFTEKNLLSVNIADGKLSFQEDKGRKSSDETGLHLAIYKTTSANCVLHSHLLEGLLFAELYPEQENIFLPSLELLKGFKGVKTHETQVLIPCFDNAQDIGELSQRVSSVLSSVSSNVYGFLLRGHGLYVWGDSVKDAKRHLEVFEYIFKYQVALGRMIP